MRSLEPPRSYWNWTFGEDGTAIGAVGECWGVSPDGSSPNGVSPDGVFPDGVSPSGESPSGESPVVDCSASSFPAPSGDRPAECRKAKNTAKRRMQGVVFHREL